MKRVVSLAALFVMAIASQAQAATYGTVTLTLTGISWFGLGLFYGIGYCPLTDWHFNILEKMGKTDLPDSYISYLLMRFTGIRFWESNIDRLTLILFLLAFIISLIVNLKYKRSAVF